MDRAFQVEGFYEFRQIGRISVHVVASPRLARSAMTAAIRGYAAESACRQEQHLVFPGVRAQRPAMTEDYRLSATPVLVIDLRAVFCGKRTHIRISSFILASGSA